MAAKLTRQEAKGMVWMIKGLDLLTKGLIKGLAALLLIIGLLLVLLLIGLVLLTLQLGKLVKVIKLPVFKGIGKIGQNSFGIIE